MGAEDQGRNKHDQYCSHAHVRLLFLELSVWSSASVPSIDVRWRHSLAETGKFQLVVFAVTVDAVVLGASPAGELNLFKHCLPGAMDANGGIPL